MGGSSSTPAPAPAPEVTPKTLRNDNPYVVKGRLEELKDIDVIVNSTDRSLQLSSGGDISNVIKREGGPKIQEELDQNYPDGIKPDEIAVTDGHNLPYDYVYHCSIQAIEKRISHHKIRETISECLNVAKNQTQVSSIAFPVIGTGSMNFAPRILRTIYTTILEFLIEHPSYKVYIIIHPSKTDLLDYLKKISRSEELSRLEYPATIPTSWSHTDGVHRIPLQSSNSDYQWIEKKINETIGKSITIKKIERIENKRIFVAYERFKHNLNDGGKTEKFLWHGTSQDNIDSIARYGFDWRLTNRAVYGQGCYFAVNASYSDDDTYSVPNSKNEKCIFLAYVVSGKCMPGNSSITEKNISSNIQSTVNQKEDIYVTYDDDQQYPAFVVVYKHC